MGEIKFRAWDKKLKVMALPNNKAAIGVSLDGKVFAGGYPMPYMVPMRFIGLRDSNRTEEHPDGREIYEGDVLALWEDEQWSIHGVVEYCDDKGCMYAGAFILVDAEGHISQYWEDDWSVMCDYLEVIGNIYENGELLNAEK